MKHDSITSIRQRLAMGGNNRRSGLLMQPGMRRRHARFQAKTLDHHRALTRRDGEIDQHRRRAFLSKHFIKPDDTTFARNELMAAALANLFEHWIEKRILEFLGDDGS